MKPHWFFLIPAFLLLQCAKGVVPKVDTIQILYIGSIYNDFKREDPISAVKSGFPGIKVTHTITDPAFLEYHLYRAGLSELLNELEIDFVIADTVPRNQKFFGIQRKTGYAITNFEGIRFAMFSTSQESLTIEDQIQLALVRERSDILWIINQPVLKRDPTLITFFIKNRAVYDTSMSPVKAAIDTTRIRLIKDFTKKIENELGEKLFIGGSIDEYFFSHISDKHAIDVVVYPTDLIIKMFEGDSTTLGELFGCIAFEKKFRKTKMNEKEISEICAANGFLQWGQAKEENNVLIPDAMNGMHIFDFYTTEEPHEN